MTPLHHEENTERNLEAPSWLASGMSDADSPRPALGTHTTAHPTAIKLSVILPVYNAMPWLPITMLHLLSQRLDEDAPLELLVGFDGGDDGSLDFLLRLVAELGAPRATDEVCTAGVDAAACNPALALPLRAAETADHPSFAASEAPQAQQPLSVRQVAAACRPEHRLRVLRHGDGVIRGQGHAMSLALSHARAELIAQMESDDERASPAALATMIAALEARPDWDGVSCAVELVGWSRPGMAEYVAWQNSLLSPEEMAAARFIEIPALHQTAIFRRAAVDHVLASSGGRYRDGPAAVAAAAAAAATSSASAAPAAVEAAAVGAAAAGDELDTPVDLWWWLAFFDCGKRCGKLGPNPNPNLNPHPNPNPNPNPKQLRQAGRAAAARLATAPTAAHAHAWQALARQAFEPWP